MVDLLRGELIKLRTTRTALGFAGVALLLVVAGSILAGIYSDPSSEEDLRTTLSSTGLAVTVFLLYGAVGATGEHRHRTITSALLVAPDRVRVTFGKLIAFAVSGAIAGVVLQAIAFACALPFFDSSVPSLTGKVALDLLAGATVAAALGAALGVAVGVLLRSQVPAVVGLLLYIFVLEQVVVSVSDQLAPYALTTAFSALGGAGSDHHFSGPVSGLVLLAWLAVIGTIGIALDRRRDVS